MVGIRQENGADRSDLHKYIGVLTGYEIKDIPDYIRAVKENDIPELYIPAKYK